ncbi:hypothetical protein BGZ61DRAFT_437625 [Ilyonectria robusta]|uniref:uncharacterized protein n=1 Tax=Ilyonectria robusta TaxID=1079257 RepID=UPI001E8DBDB5|nr:uncharacterized protein BGZ61DRAFT_437625 [Ilyonectria robusta]KAH8737092.1 hypothetical protein BGZ61DRAFT_437625 [Ilyonectria robusta]
MGLNPLTPTTAAVRAMCTCCSTVTGVRRAGKAIAPVHPAYGRSTLCQQNVPKPPTYFKQRPGQRP